MQRSALCPGEGWSDIGEMIKKKKEEIQGGRNYEARCRLMETTVGEAQQSRHSAEDWIWVFKIRPSV